MKLASGPATTMAARGADLLMDEACLRSASDMAGGRVAIGNAGGVLVAEELDVAAERNGGNLPAGAVAIVEPEQLAAEADGEDQNPHAVPARDQKMAELVEEHHDGQNEQKRDGVAQDTATQRAHTRQEIQNS